MLLVAYTVYIIKWHKSAHRYLRSIEYARQTWGNQYKGMFELAALMTYKQFKQDLTNRRLLAEAAAARQVRPASYIDTIDAKLRYK